MKSYNCFYSALYDIIEKYYGNKTQLIINNRWQFFYRQSENYSDDKRMIGEWPMLYDESHLQALQEKLGIKILITKNLNCSQKAFLQIEKSKPKMLFVNKINLLFDSSLRQEHKCVSTIIIQNIRDKTFYCHTYDKELSPFQQIDINVLYSAWIEASDYKHLNGCDISIKIFEKCKLQNLDKFAIECMKYSLTNYMESSGDESIYVGRTGMKKFSEEILNWDNDIDVYRKFIDCSMYIDILIKQRLCFISTLKNIMINNKRIILENLYLLIEKWNKLKILFFIIGIRKQRGAIKQLSQSVNELEKLEVSLASKMLDNIV